MVIDAAGIMRIQLGKNDVCLAELQLVGGVAAHSGVNPGGPYSRLVIEAARAQVGFRPEIRQWLDALPADYETYG